LGNTAQCFQASGRKGYESMLTNIKHLVLEGGGTRCTWQAGFISALQEKSTIRPDIVWSVSASSAIACAMASGRLESAVQCFKSCIAANKRNIYLGHLFNNRPIFPQAAIYREALLKTFDQPAMETLHHGPEIQVLITRTCPRLTGYSGVFAGLSIYALRGRSKRRRLPGLLAQFAFSKEFISAKECRTPAELADLVLASSCTPPVTPLYSFKGRTALDGGLMENIPLSGLTEDAGTTLVLRTTTRGKGLKPQPGLVFVEPSEEVRVASWDYANPGAIDFLYGLGQKDGADFVKSAQAEGAMVN
jgi:predicted acylesterase/phospholipase RssA